MVGQHCAAWIDSAKRIVALQSLTLHRRAWHSLPNRGRTQRCIRWLPAWTPHGEFTHCGGASYVTKQICANYRAEALWCKFYGEQR
eukprot:9486920-Pyramimonas_sp.AAC.1